MIKTMSSNFKMSGMENATALNWELITRAALVLHHVMISKRSIDISQIIELLKKFLALASSQATFAIEPLRHSPL